MQTEDGTDALRNPVKTVARGGLFLVPIALLVVLVVQAMKLVARVLDRLLVVVRTAERKLERAFGPDFVRRAGDRRALIEASIVANSAFSAHAIQQELGAADARWLRAVYGIYLLESGEVWSPRLDRPRRIGLAPAPRDLAEFVELGDAIVRSERIAAILDTGG